MLHARFQNKINRHDATTPRKTHILFWFRGALASWRFILLLLCLCGSGASAAPEPRMPAYETKYYTLCTDVDRAFADDLVRRLDLMYEEYARRLVEFVPARGAPKFKVYVFSR